MDTADKLINNLAPKRLIILFSAIFVFSIITCWLVCSECAGMITSMQIRSVLSALSGSTDLTGLPSNENIQAGELLCSQSGFTADMDPELMESFSQTRLILFSVSSVSCFVLCTAGLIISLVTIFRSYNQIESVRLDCIRLTEDTSFRPTVHGEDFSCIRRLSDSVTRMGEQMDYLTGRLTKEKNFLKEFLSDFSHQLRTSIAVVRLNTDICNCIDDLDTEKKTQLSDEIQQNLDDMEEMVMSSLKLSKLNADSVVYNKKKNDLTPMCKEAVKKISPAARNAHVDIEIIQTHPVYAVFDKLWLREAIENIIKNSIDHSGCSQIKLDIKDSATAVTIIICDNGSGIPQDQISGLFERFGKMSKKSGMTSIGIGMSIADKIVRAHNGQILVYSSESDGTKFEIVLLKL
ncbi:MAG: HAMP domain-containing sensor histidine kinase [Oscillospiraceae bacterium]|nr:HAMP domain-containing sensor histidine kinase [Oscillospiraceae bacterium]